MAADLEASRQLAESSSAQLTAANQAIEERRRELETIVETIPSGVVTLDGAGVVLQSNRAFAALMGRATTTASGEGSMRCCLPDCADDLAGVIGADSAWARLPPRLNFTRGAHHSPGRDQRAA
jgi:two-component system nitrogen regulation sensor histidine kinase NtrY